MEEEVELEAVRPSNVAWPLLCLLSTHACSSASAELCRGETTMYVHRDDGPTMTSGGVRGWNEGEMAYDALGVCVRGYQGKICEAEAFI